jgi:hypothetical protein
MMEKLAKRLFYNYVLNYLLSSLKKQAGRNGE